MNAVVDAGKDLFRGFEVELEHGEGEDVGHNGIVDERER